MPSHAQQLPASPPLTPKEELSYEDDEDGSVYYIWEGNDEEDREKEWANFSMNYEYLMRLRADDELRILNELLTDECLFLCLLWMING